MNTALLYTWVVWDRLYQHITGLEPVSIPEDNLFRIHIVPYRGEPLTTNDNVTFVNGDWICRLHIYNCNLMRQLHGISDQNRLALSTLSSARRSLPGLAEYLVHHPQGDKIKGILGTTVLYRGADKLGFTVAELPPTLYNKIKHLFMLLMLSLCHPDGTQRLKKNPDKLVVKCLAMSKETLYAKYGTKGIENREKRQVVNNGSESAFSD